MLIPFETLRKRFNVRPTGVLHVGANVGEEAEAYHHGGIKTVVWIEGNPDLLPALRENLAEYPHNYIFNFLAGDENRRAILHVSNNAGQSSSVLELGTHKIAHPEVHYTHDVEVPMYRLDEPGVLDFYVVDGYIPLLDDLDFLNIDAQGFELNILKGMGEKLRQFKWAYLEVNKKELYKGCALVEDLDMYLLGFGFRRVVTEWAGNTGWGDALWVRK